MSNALHRVISDPSELGDQQIQGGGEERQEEQYLKTDTEEIGTAQSPAASTFPHTILMEDDDFPTTSRNNATSGRGGMGQSDSSSSLSDGSVENRMIDEEMDTAEVPSGNMLDRTSNYPGAPPHHDRKFGAASGEPMDQEESGVLGPDLNNDVMGKPRERTINNSSTATNTRGDQKQPTQPNSGGNGGMFDRMDSADNESSHDGSFGSQRNGASSQTSSRDWGWFEDVHIASERVGGGLTHSIQGGGGGGNDNKGREEMILSTPQDIRHPDEDAKASAMAVTAPNYVLEESLSNQKLWKNTAGTRPPQPMEERAFFEKMWAQNFARSQVNYSMPVEVLTAGSPISLNPFADGIFEGVPTTEGSQIVSYGHYVSPGGAASTQITNDGVMDGDAAVEAALISRMHDMTEDCNKSSITSVRGLVQQQNQNQKIPGSKIDGDLTVLLRGPNAFGTTVSKSFARSTENGSAIVGVDTVNISLASYRVVESRKYGKYAQFLVIYREGSIRDTVGIWKRYRDFEELSHKVTQAHEGCAGVIANMSPLAMTEEPDTEHLPNAITSWRLLKKRKRWYRCLDAGYLSLKVFLLERFLHDILFESSSPKLLRDFVLGPGSHGPE